MSGPGRGARIAAVIGALLALAALVLILLDDGARAPAVTGLEDESAQRDRARGEAGSGSGSAVDADEQALPGSDGGPAADEAFREETPGLLVQGTVTGAAEGALHARLAYATRELRGVDWLFEQEVAWTKPKPVDADGSFRFAGPWDESLARRWWRVEVGLLARGEGDEQRGRTGLLTLGASEAFLLREGEPRSGITVAVQPPATLVLPLHDWHLLPLPEGGIRPTHVAVEAELEERGRDWPRPPAFWITEPQARQTVRVRVSPLHAGNRVRVRADVSGWGDTPEVRTAWHAVRPGESLCAPLLPPPVGMVEVFVRGTRALFPPREPGFDLSKQLELRLTQLADTRMARQYRTLVDPAVTDEQYESEWGMAPMPSQAWNGEDFVIRLGWHEAGRWSIAVEAGHLRRVATPIEVEVRPFAVSRVSVDWLEPLEWIRIRPEGGPTGADAYVLATWAVMPDGALHLFQTGIQEQRARSLLAPPGARAIATTSQWHGSGPDGRARSTVCHFAGSLADAVPLDPGDAPPGAEAADAPDRELLLQAGPTRHLLALSEPDAQPERPVTRHVELRPLEGQMGGRAQPFVVRGGVPLELWGFPPGRYAVSQVEAGRAEGAPLELWGTIEIRRPPADPAPSPEGEGN